MIKLSNKIIFNKNSSIKLFISKIFYNLNDNYKNKKATLKNENVNSINE